MPSLAPDEYAGLKESIRRHGVLYPVVVDHEGAIIDGHHRLAIVREIKERVGLRVVVLVPRESDLSPAKLKSKIEKAFPETRTIFAVGSRSWDNADPPITYRRLWAGANPQEVARTLNLDRRHLTVEERLTLTAELRAKGTSIRGIAKATGISKTQVSRDIEQVSPTGHVNPDGSPDGPVLLNIDTSSTVTGTDGKTYKASKPKKAKEPRKPTKAESHAQMVEMAEKIRANTPEAKRERARLAAIEYIEADGWPQFLRLVDDLSQQYGTP